MGIDIEDLKTAVASASKEISAAAADYVNAAAAYSESFQNEADSSRKAVSSIDNALSACGTVKSVLNNRLEKLLIGGDDKAIDSTDSKIRENNEKAAVFKARKQLIVNHRIKGDAALFQGVDAARNALQTAREHGQEVEKDITAEINEMIHSLESFRDSIHVDIFGDDRRPDADYQTLQSHAVEGVLVKDQLREDAKAAAEEKLLEKAIADSDAIAKALEQKEAEKAAAEEQEKRIAILLMPLRHKIEYGDRTEEKFLQPDGTYSLNYATSVLADKDLMEERKYYIEQQKQAANDSESVK